MICGIYFIRPRIWSKILYKTMNWNVRYMSRLFTNSNIILKLITSIIIYELYILINVYA
jgi:hypothetical protein